jgi:hypothetical protein
VIINDRLRMYPTRKIKKTTIITIMEVVDFWSRLFRIFKDGSKEEHLTLQLRKRDPITINLLLNKFIIK